MARLMFVATLALMLTLTWAPRAEAHIFEPQHNWWHSGRTCIESRNPPGPAWDDLPPRACVAQEDVAQGKQSGDEDVATPKNEVWTIAFVSVERADKRPPRFRRRA